MRRLLILALLALPLAPAQAAGHRVLSLNLCTDQLLLAVADPADILGLTRLASDCRMSAACREAALHPAVRGTAEEVIALSPSLVLGGPAAAGPAIRAARRLGIPVLSLDPPNTLEAIRDQVAIVAAALGHPERGRAVIEAFDRALAAVPPPREPRPTTAVLAPNGFTTGPDSLASHVLRRAGLDNYAAREGIGAYAVLPLERLVAHPPALLMTDAPSGQASLAEAVVWHPALARTRRVEVPGRLLLCGTPATAEAVAILARARLALP